MRATIHPVLISLLVATAIGASASAQDFPTKTVTIVVPTPPGGPMDLLARLVGESLHKRWNQPVVVDNKPGAGALLGATTLARAAPDGYTLLVHNNALPLYKLFVKDMPWETERNIAPLTKAMTTPYVIAASEQAPGKTLVAIVDYGKSNPGKLNFAVIPNSSQELETLRLFQRAGIQGARVGYNGAVPMMRALLGNEVNAYIGTPLGMAEQFRTGKLIPLAVTGIEKMDSLPDVPTVKSTGIDYDASSWYAFFTTGGTPRTIVEKLSADIRAALSEPEINAQIKAQGYQPVQSTPDELAKAMAGELAEMTKVARDANIVPQ